ncbi:MAG: hydrogenase nickel incorporation protein HypB [Bacteroidetes bacterium]|jgi:hydrogenase nickel incorporation protein HypB|nr:hydrogenase nickel incorporation protein HypB [Bacteroidota bacterium]
MSIVTVERTVLAKNDEIARQNRSLFASLGTYVINVVSSPGSGKTTLLERTLERLTDRLSIAVVEGDVQTDIDARRLERFRIPTAQIVTNGGCHLEANLVRDAIARLPLSGVKLLVIENVGNLVCPSNYDLGEHDKVVVLSVTEGAEKPLKYPAMFQRASVLVINKIDLLPYVDCRLDELRANALSINPSLKVFEVSATKGNGVDSWCDWLSTKALTP